VSSALLVAPLALLAPLMFIDMGLFLVVVVPVGFATLLAAGRRVAGWRLGDSGCRVLFYSSAFSRRECCFRQ
jgi:hypothetical protein